MRFTDDARALIHVAGEISRFRGVDVCDLSDLALAFALISERPRGELFPDVARSPTPEMMPYHPAIVELLEHDEVVDVEKLRSLTAAARSRLRRLLE